MSDQILLVRGMLPWTPSPGAELLKVYHRYDQPLQGILDQDGALYLFECVAGEVGPWSVWIYSYVQASEVAALDEAEGEEFEALVAHSRAERPCKLALSMENAGIVVVANVLDMRGGLKAGFEELVALFNEHLEDLRRASVEIEHADWTKLAAS